MPPPYAALVFMFITVVVAVAIVAYLDPALRFPSHNITLTQTRVLKEGIEASCDADKAKY